MVAFSSYSVLVWSLSLTVSSTEAFTTSRSLASRRIVEKVAASTTQRKALPLSVTIDLPSWLVEASSKVPTTEGISQQLVGLNGLSDLLESLNGRSDQLFSALTLPATITAFNTQPIDPVTLNSLLSLSLTSWHVGAIAAFTFGSSLLFFLNSPDNQKDAPYQPGTTTYSPQAAADFYSKRPLLVLKRVLRLALLTGAFNAGVLFDWLVLGKFMGDLEYTALQKAEPRRAKQALKLCEQLGPTFIKLGQALSIRTDLIPAAYALELRQLQDAVPPFDSDQAYDVLRTQYQVDDLSQIFSKLSDKPVASASIGQVYRGNLASNGKDVAVKVQRPGILAEIALDLHVLRILTPIQTKLQNAVNGAKTTQDDIDTAILLVDEWGRGFVAETDYRLEAQNTIAFEAAMRKRGLDAVTAPQVVQELVRDTVLVTEWVQGTRLDRDASPDVPRLCGVAINAYLTMLLDTGVLHCDPHPGNLLRTTDGKLCILDWGMTLEVPNGLQYALLEFIAHINAENYDSIPQDFINLGFSPEGVTAERLKDSGITEGLTFAFRQLSGGGGPKKIQERVKAEFQERYGSDLSDEDLQKAARAEMLERAETQLAAEGVDVKGVTNVMEEMSRRNRELFALPPYVLYVARAFSTLEGIGLSIDDNYAIVQECYPYLSRRLFTDRSPRAKKALRAMLGLSEDANDEEMMIASSPSSALAVVQAGAAQGKGPSTRSPGALSPGKLVEMSEGFASYTAATTAVDKDGAGQLAAATEFSKLFLDPKGSTLQDILVDETARFGDAATRAALRASLVESVGAKAVASAMRAPKELLQQSPLYSILPGPLKAALIDRPAEFPQLVAALLASSQEDERILASAQELRDVLSTRVSSRPSAVKDGHQASPISSSNANNLEQVTSLLSNESTRKMVVDQLPGVGALGRRVGAGLLRRAAYRTNKSILIPDEVRRRLVDANNALADAIDLEEQEEK